MDAEKNGLISIYDDLKKSHIDLMLQLASGKLDARQFNFDVSHATITRNDDQK